MTSPIPSARTHVLGLKRLKYKVVMIKSRVFCMSRTNFAVQCQFKDLEKEEKNFFQPKIGCSWADLALFEVCYFDLVSSTMI